MENVLNSFEFTIATYKAMLMGILFLTTINIYISGCQPYRSGSREWHGPYSTPLSRNIHELTVNCFLLWEYFKASLR